MRRRAPRHARASVSHATPAREGRPRGWAFSGVSRARLVAKAPPGPASRPARLTRPGGAATLGRARGDEPWAGTGASVTPSEIAFLALGVLLGSAVGAAIVQSLA